MRNFLPIHKTTKSEQQEQNMELEVYFEDAFFKTIYPSNIKFPIAVNGNLVKISHQEASRNYSSLSLFIRNDTPSLNILSHSLAITGSEETKRFLKITTSQDKTTKFISVWRLPFFLTPDDSRAGNQQPAGTHSFQTPKKVSVTPAIRSGSKNNPLKERKDCKLAYQFVPAHINVVFMLGSNGSGKSLIIEKWHQESPKDLLVIEPEPSISKKVHGKNYGFDGAERHISIPQDDLQTLNDHINKGKFPELASLFFRLTSGRWNLLQDNHSSNLVLFCRQEDHGRSVPFTFGMVSDGLRQLFHIILLLKRQTTDLPRIVVLDEPESHLHPALYLNLVKELLLPQFLQKGSKLVIATHNFHVVEAISVIEVVHPIVVEVSSKWSDYYQGRIGDQYYSETTRDKLLSDVSVNCYQSQVFLQSEIKNPPAYSPELMQDMTNQKRIVIYCESIVDGPDSQLYSLMFDTSQVEIRSAALHKEKNSSHGCAEVKARVSAARKARELLQTQSPVLYYGIRDRDRNIFHGQETDQDLIILPCAELENVLWNPSLWPALPFILSFLEEIYPPLNVKEIVEARLKEFAEKAQNQIRQKFLMHLTEYAVSAQESCINKWKALSTGSVTQSTIEEIRLKMTLLPQKIELDFSPFQRMLIKADEIVASGFSSDCGIVNDCNPNQLLTKFFTLATSEPKDALRSYWSLINDKQIANLFCESIFNWKIIEEKRLEKVRRLGKDAVPRYPSGKVARLLYFYEGIILRTNWFCGFSHGYYKEFEEMRDILLLSFKDILLNATYPTAEVYGECKRNLTEVYFRK